MSLITAVILAAGKGSRMKSDLPKVLHRVNGKSMLSYCIEAACKGGAEDVVLVLGHQAQMVRDHLQEDYHYAIQEPQLGTGHALQMAMPAVGLDCQYLLVLCGDTPLLRGETIESLLQYASAERSACTVLSAVLDDPSGYGRLIRDDQGNLQAIVEEKDANQQEKAVREINTGTYCFSFEDIAPLINNLDNNNAQGEYYLTDLIAALVAEGKQVKALAVRDNSEIMGVNDRIALAEAAKILRQRKNQQLMAEGITILDPDNTYIEDDCFVGRDTVIEPQTYLRGKTVVGKNCHIGPDSDIRDSEIGDGTVVLRAMVVESRVGQACNIGPFAYIRPQSYLEDKVKVGHFVELKKSRVGQGSKIPHLSYIGDATLGSGVNIGCGTITCNYDGYNKYATIIEDGSFIGSNSNLVAPVRVEKNSIIAAGSTITNDVPEDALAIARGKQVNIESWASKRRGLMEKED